MCRNAAVRFLTSLAWSCCQRRLVSVASSRASSDLCHPSSYYNSLRRRTFRTGRGCVQRAKPLALLQSLTFGLREEVTLCCSLFHLLFLAALSDPPVNPPLSSLHAFTPCAQRCLFSAAALLTFGGSEASLVKLTNLVTRSCCLGAEQ